MSTYPTTPAEYRAYNREKQREHRARRGPKSPAGFCGVDGEGGDLDGSHEYLLLRAGEHVLDTGEPLGWRDCLPFLADLPKDSTYVAYFFDYDVTMMLRDAPETKVRRLLDRESRFPTRQKGKPFPVDLGEFQIDYLPHKEFKVRRPGQPWTVISDVGSFFQCRFVQTIADWDVGSVSDREQIAAGKDARATFGVITDEIRTYNALEIRLLEQLMNKFRATCEAVGYVPVKWQGPGNMAVAMFRRHGVKQTRTLPIADNRPLLEAAQAAYYGGRFETTAVGPIPGPVFQYDINSAYPDAMTQLPCLEHGHWSRNLDRGELALQRVRFWDTEPASLYGLPIRRKDGSIFYPGQGNGWYWSVELDAARPEQSWEVLESWNYLPDCDCQPFDWIPDLYAQRKQLGKAARGRILKLGLNSLYGKTAQSIGTAPYANPISASLITAITRAKLLDMVRYLRDDTVVMLATDGVFSTRQPDGWTPADNLGAWGLDVHPDGMFLIQPGLYLTSDELQPKTRGIPRGAVIEHADAFRAAYDEMLHGGTIQTVPIPLRAFLGLRAAAHRNRIDLAGQWLPVTKTVSFDWQNKRVPHTTLHRNGVMKTLPYSGGPDLHSVPYSKQIGALLNENRLDLDDNPDWTQTLT